MILLTHLYFLYLKCNFDVRSHSLPHVFASRVPRILHVNADIKQHMKPLAHSYAMLANGGHLSRIVPSYRQVTTNDMHEAFMRGAYPGLVRSRGGKIVNSINNI